MSSRFELTNDGQSYQLTLLKLIKQLMDTIKANQEKPNVNPAAIRFSEELLEALKVASMLEDNLHHQRRTIDHQQLIIKVYAEELNQLREQLTKLQSAELIEVGKFKSMRDRVVADQIKALP